MFKKKILLTGGNGFIGRNVLEILNKKYKILAPSRAELNLLESKDVISYLRLNKPNLVLHAAIVGSSRSSNKKSSILKDNLLIFHNLLAGKNFYNRMIVLGSGAEYDKRRILQDVSEKDFGVCIPVDEYGFSKYVMSKYAESVDFITHLRLFGVFGKYEEYQTRFISNTICKALFNLPITINQNVYFDYIFIDDVVEIINKFIDDKPKEVFYNIGSGQKIDLITIAKIILQITEKDLPIIVKKEGLNNEYTCNTSKLSSEFRDINITELNKSISELVDYYKGILDNLDKKLFLKDF